MKSLFIIKDFSNVKIISLSFDIEKYLLFVLLFLSIFDINSLFCLIRINSGISSFLYLYKGNCSFKSCSCRDLYIWYRLKFCRPNTHIKKFFASETLIVFPKIFKTLKLFWTSFFSLKFNIFSPFKSISFSLNPLFSFG